MKKNLLINIIVVIFMYILPIYFLNLYQDDYKNINFIQNFCLIILGTGSFISIFFNINYLKTNTKSKSGPVFFIALALILLIISTFNLYLLFSTRHGIGF